MFRLAMLVASGVGMPLTAINGPATASAPAVRQPAAVVTFCEVGCEVYDVKPGQQLDMVLNLGGTADELRARCDEMGGNEIVPTPGFEWSTCTDIDF